jgi:hypothetical protein
MKSGRETAAPGAPRKRPPKRDFVLEDAVTADASERGTVEIFHSLAKTPKGPTLVGPFDFRDLMVAGAGFEPATFGL